MGMGNGLSADEISIIFVNLRGAIEIDKLEIPL
jgi:hypothetical protein